MLSGESIELTIKNIIRETSNVNTYIVSPVPRRSFTYKAGQFLTLLFNRNGREIRRSFSFSSTPGVDDEIAITVKRVHNGEISRLLLDYYKIGDNLHALEPAGKFTLPGDVDSYRTIFLMAAGSGITPVYSILKELMNCTRLPRVLLFYQNHTVEDTLFRKQLERLQEQFADRFTWLDFVSSSNLSHNKLTNDYLEQLITRYLLHEAGDALFYLCGPISFMRMCKYTIRVMGFDEAQVRTEHFVIDAAPPAPPITDPSPHLVTIHAGGKILSFETRYPDTILQSALNQNIQLPYSCKGGRCSACVAKVNSGEIVMSMNDVLTEQDIRSGLVLTCVGYAATDISLLYDK